LRTPNISKAIEKQKISFRGPNTRRILKACRERSKKINMRVVSKTLGNRCCALTLKKAIVVPILKADKDPTSTASYRPISLTSIMGKTMERIINTRLNCLLETNNIIANEQVGIRIHRSTSEHKDAVDNKHVLTAVFVDFKSAYDSVWKENLLLKLIRSGIRSNLLHWLESFISHRAYKV
jgi:hypothetical protein